MRFEVCRPSIADPQEPSLAGSIAWIGISLRGRRYRTWVVAAKQHLSAQSGCEQVGLFVNSKKSHFLN
jgi:hypothetical protein